MSDEGALYGTPVGPFDNSFLAIDGDEELFQQIVYAAVDTRRLLKEPEDVWIEVRLPGTPIMRATADRLRERLAAEYVTIAMRGIR